MQNGKFGTCLNCIDGRIQLPVIQWIKEHYSIDFVDMITEAGIDGVLSDKNSYILPILNKINISLKTHMSKIIFIVGHFDCAGNPVDNETHKKNISSAVSRLKSNIDNYNIVGLWVSEKWEVKKIYEH